MVGAIIRRSFFDTAISSKEAVLTVDNERVAPLASSIASQRLFERRSTAGQTFGKGVQEKMVIGAISDDTEALG